ncbi:hypothetical protein ACFS3C_06625 [Azotobacter vinelandii]
MRLPTGSPLEAVFPSHIDHQPGEQVGIGVAAEHLVIFPIPDNGSLQPDPTSSGVRRYSEAC